MIAAGPNWELRLGDCIEGMRTLADCSVDAVVTDPPAGIGFMGKGWDSDKGGRDHWIAWLSGVMAEVLRVLKPGGHALVWALPRTSHWTATAIEDAGLEIRDVVMHLFGSGFPKSLDMGKAIGSEWSGWGSALKPAAEHWVLARKPLEGTYAANVTKHGTGAINVDGCRVAGDMSGGSWGSPSGDSGFYTPGENKTRATRPGGERHSLGRWPAHLVLSHAENCGAACNDECPVRVMDEQSGELVSGSMRAGTPRGDNAVFGKMGGAATEADITSSSGGASRFFYIAKAPRAEKDAGLEHLPRKSGGEATGREDGSKGTQNPRAGAGRNGGARNIHPTVKSVDLMRWLCRLVTPPGGLVLDAFAGSGTTGVACIEEGFRFVGFELGPDYFEIATARLRGATRQLSLFAPKEPETEAKPNPAQPSLFDGAA